MKRFFLLFYTAMKALKHQIHHMVFTKVLEEWKPKDKWLQGKKKVAGAPINHGDNLYTVLWPITASLQQEFYLDLPWRATTSTVISADSSKCAVGCLKRVLSGATKEMFQETNDVELWANKCYTFTWSCHCDGTEAFIIKPRKHKILETLSMNYMLITDLRCTTFKMFSFCLR